MRAANRHVAKDEAAHQMASNPLPRAGAKADRQRNVGAAGFVTDRNASNISLLSHRRRCALWPREIGAISPAMPPPNMLRLVLWITLSASLLGALFAYAENRPLGIADFVNTELHGRWRTACRKLRRSLPNGSRVEDARSGSPSEGRA